MPDNTSFRVFVYTASNRTYTQLMEVKADAFAFEHTKLHKQQNTSSLLFSGV